MQCPKPPAANACCGTGCKPCVWDLYDQELTRYETWLASDAVADEAIWGEPLKQAA
jgi:Oxidoreductase-like protein, N-terminal